MSSDREKKIKIGRQYEKSLRKNITRAEKHLRKCINQIRKNYNVKIFYKFQYGWYDDQAFFISDFYFPRAKITIELDGIQHDSIKQKIQDKRKSDYLLSQGISTLRMYNSTILNMDYNGVMAYLIEKRLI